MNQTPLRVTSWSLKCERRCGAQESSDMLASTRGPSRNPAWAATINKAASVRRIKDDQDAVRAASRAKEAAEDAGKKTGIESFAGLVFDLIQKIAKQDAARRESQRGRHVKHGLFAGFDARLTQNLQTVAYCFDAGISAAAETVSVQ